MSRKKRDFIVFFYQSAQRKSKSSTAQSDGTQNVKYYLLFSYADLTRDKIFDTSIDKAESERHVLSYTDDSGRIA